MFLQVTFFSIRATNPCEGVSINFTNLDFRIFSKLFFDKKLEIVQIALFFWVIPGFWWDFGLGSDWAIPGHWCSFSEAMSCLILMRFWSHVGRWNSSSFSAFVRRQEFVFFFCKNILGLFLFPADLDKHPWPSCREQPHIITLLSPCFTVSVELLGWCLWTKCTFKNKDQTRPVKPKHKSLPG